MRSQCTIRCRHFVLYQGNLDDTEAAIRYGRREPEQRKVPRDVLKDNPVTKRRRFKTQRQDLNEVKKRHAHCCYTVAKACRALSEASFGSF